MRAIGDQGKGGGKVGDFIQHSRSLTQTATGIAQTAGRKLLQAVLLSSHALAVPYAAGPSYSTQISALPNQRAHVRTNRHKQTLSYRRNT